MFNKIHKFLGKAFLSCTAFFWAGCDNGTADANKEKPFIDIEQELAKISKPDTTGLRGQCVSMYTYCENVKTGGSSYYSLRNRASSIAKNKLESEHNLKQNNRCLERFLEIENEPLYGISVCYDDLKYINMPPPSFFADSLFFDDYKSEYEAAKSQYETFAKDYDVTPCDSSNDKATVNDRYIKALLQNDLDDRDIIRQKLEEINQGMEECKVP